MKMTVNQVKDLADALKPLLPDATYEISVKHPDDASLTVDLGEASLTISGLPGGDEVVAVPAFGSLGKYLTEEDRKANLGVRFQIVKWKPVEIATHIANTFVPILRITRNKLESRRQMARERYENRKEIGGKIEDMSHKAIQSHNFGVELYGQAEGWTLSGEIRQSGQVDLYLSLSPEVAYRIVAALAEKGG